LLVLSRFHFPAPLCSMVVTHFLATTGALTSSGWLFGPCEHEHQCLRWGSSLLTSPTCRAVLPPTMQYASAGFSFVSMVSSAGRTGFYLGIPADPHSGAWVSTQDFAVTEPARPSYHTESSSSLGSLEPRPLRTGTLLPVALHGRFTPPQFLSTTGSVTLILTGTSTPLRCALSQSHSVIPPG
jgi:hypothetical protein